MHMIQDQASEENTHEDDHSSIRYQCQEGWILIFDKCYMIIRRRVTVFTAMYWCARYNAHLPTINSDAVLDGLIATFNSSATQYWINLFKTSNDTSIHWKWRRNPESDYFRWAVGQPQRTKYSRHCCIFNGLLNPSGFDDVNCYTSASYLCQKDPLKVGYISDDSVATLVPEHHNSKGSNGNSYPSVSIVSSLSADLMLQDPIIIQMNIFSGQLVPIDGDFRSSTILNNLNFIANSEGSRLVYTTSSDYSLYAMQSTSLSFASFTDYIEDSISQHISSFKVGKTTTVVLSQSSYAINDPLDSSLTTDVYEQKKVFATETIKVSASKTVKFSDSTYPSNLYLYDETLAVSQKNSPPVTSSMSWIYSTMASASLRCSDLFYKYLVTSFGDQKRSEVLVYAQTSNFISEIAKKSYFNNSSTTKINEKASDVVYDESTLLFDLNYLSEDTSPSLDLMNDEILPSPIYQDYHTSSKGIDSDDFGLSLPYTNKVDALIFQNEDNVEFTQNSTANTDINSSLSEQFTDEQIMEAVIEFAASMPEFKNYEFLESDYQYLLQLEEKSQQLALQLREIEAAIDTVYMNKTNLLAVKVVAKKYRDMKNWTILRLNLSGNDSILIEIPKEPIQTKSEDDYVIIIAWAMDMRNTSLRKSFRMRREQVNVGDLIASCIVYPSKDYTHDFYMKPVSVTFRGVEIPSNHVSSCGFLTPSGNWSIDGLRTAHLNSTHIICLSNHLTSFAILFQQSDVIIPNQHDHILTIITYVGTIVSLFCLGLTIATYTCIRRFHSLKGFGHANLSLSILISNITFIAGIDSYDDKISCSVISVILHYLFLTTFCWMLVEALILYRKTLELSNVFPSTAKRYYFLVGWGSPMVVVIISFIVNSKAYGKQRRCWMTNVDGFIWSFIGPLLVINVVILVRVMKALLSLQLVIRQSEIQKVKTTIKAIISLLPILGLTWYFGVAFYWTGSVVFAYCFVIFHSFQGVFMMYVLCLSSKEVHKRNINVSKMMRRNNMVAQQSSS
ncbi:Adhesion G protein-coupled receptor L1 [Trichoplax sp. H2]|nr:Adhesion G protein-coupled receptor L1 [Trichoplax sp. H2]|eukprot:RDD42179.1 Adhesion G protein-coupled receptor L1 [Trichoplax sp. H2]